MIDPFPHRSPNLYSEMDPSKIPPWDMAEVPAMKPPAGQNSNFVHPEANGTLAATTIVVVSVLGGLTVFILGLRVYTRAFLTKSMGWDDCKIIA